MCPNPLLDYEEFCPYSKIEAKYIGEAVNIALEKSYAKLEEILKQKAEQISFKSSLHALIELEYISEKVWLPVENLLSLKANKELREAANEARPLIVKFFNELAMDERVYSLVKTFAQSDEAKNLNPERARYLKNLILDFKLSGAELNNEDKSKLKELNLLLADLSHKFSDNVTDSKFELVLSEDDCKGLPKEALEAAKILAEEFRRQLGPEKIPENSYVINLDYPSYMPFMRFAENANLRKILYLAYLNQGSKNASKGLLETSEPGALSNEDLIDEILQAQLAKAKLLGYPNFASLSLETKMAPNPEKVREFLERLGSKAKELAKQEYNELIGFQQKINYTNTENNPNKIYPWDKEYLSEKLRKEKYNYDFNELKEYFELNQVLAGMLNLATKLFRIEFEKVNDIEVWDKDVIVLAVKDQDSQKTLGIIYLDLYPRDLKRQGAWLMPLVSAYTDSNGKRHQAQCALVCNLTKSTANQPSLLSHQEVETLFHEFGHALHHLLSDIELEPLAGTNVEWDFVELPSQFMENFTWEKISLDYFAKHYQNQNPIPDRLLEAVLKSRIFQEGLACIRQVEFALFDLGLYMQEEIKISALELYKEIVAKYGIFEYYPGTNFPCGFSHIFAGGYAAGYYSYKWAELLEADVFAKFKSEGVINEKLGKKYRDTILSKGDSKSPMELFMDFMGREPNEQALLTRMGL